MSGRLVILPHKSWNVWNQDNREKVARDERLHREAEEAKAAKDKLLLQEQNLEVLRDGEVVIKIENSSKEAGSSSSGHVEPFRLFEDLEKQHYASLGNEDFLKEKAQKELLQKKRDGIADWALGEGSIENSKVKPWYETLGLGESATTSSSKKVDPTGIRETTRKDKADPMGSILKPNVHEYQPKIKTEPAEGGNSDKLRFLEAAGANLDSIESKENESSDSENSTNQRKRKKAHKDDRNAKSSKHKDRDRSDRDAPSKKSKHSTDRAVKADSSTASSSGSKDNKNKPSGDSDPWAELRAKRLEREAIERKRAALLMASVDIYGPGGSSTAGGSAQGYGQQYHPHLARNKR
eukprot:gene20211-22965_t